MKPFIPVLAVLLALLAMGSIYQVRESEVAIRFQFGAVIERDIKPGLHFKVPLLQNVIKVDRRILTLDSQPERYLTSEKKDVNVDFFVKWRVSDVLQFYQAGNESTALQRLRPIVTEAIRNEINQRSLQDVVGGQRTNLAERFVEVANVAAKSLGVEVVDVRIKRIDLPEDGQVISSVFQRMRAERLRVANELRAQGSEISETIRSNADRQRAVLLAQAERDAQRLRGEGDADAADTYAKAYGRDAEFYAFYRSLETYRRGFSDGESVLVLDRDSSLLRYFAEPGRGR